MNTLFKIRYYLEIIALPAFVYLVAHLSGHGLTLLVSGDHEHNHHEETHSLIETIFSVEVLNGILALILFTWLWHRPNLKKWVPCNHDHCHGELPISHVLATVALCLHFFPEAAIRHELIDDYDSTLGLIGLVGFGAHFLVDIIVSVSLSSYWKTKKGFWISLGLITATWFAAFFFAESLLGHLPHSVEGILFVVSAFLLAMFIHKPHKAKYCRS